MAKDLTSEKMLKALERLDQLLPRATELIIGGGSAMILAHGFPLATTDIDGFPRNESFAVLDPLVKQIAREQNLAGNWLNPWFATFAHVLPTSGELDLIEIYKGERLTARALGKDEMLIMKCFAHRAKDVGHGKALIKKGANVKRVRQYIESLADKNIPGAEAALDFLDDLTDQVE